MKTPNIFNLREYILISNEIKNYKALVTILDESVKTGKSKQLQLDDLARYFTYIKDKQKFIVTEIFVEPLEKIDHRREGNYSKYVEHVKYLLLKKLSTCEGYKCTFTKNNLFNFLGMVNPLYLKKVNAKQELVNKDTRISTFDFNNFYLRANDRMTKILFSSLNSLKNQFLINHKELDIIVRKDKNGIEEHKEATDEEIKILLNVKYNVLLDMELNSITQVIFKFRTEEFYRKVNEILQKEYDIYYSYKQIELLFTKKNILHELSLLESKMHRQELNDKTIDVINLHARQTYDKNIEKYDRELDDFLYNDAPAIGEYNKTAFSGFRLKSEYVDIQFELAEYLLRL